MAPPRLSRPPFVIPKKSDNQQERGRIPAGLDTALLITVYITTQLSDYMS